MFLQEKTSFYYNNSKDGCLAGEGLKNKSYFAKLIKQRLAHERRRTDFTDPEDYIYGYQKS